MSHAAAANSNASRQHHETAIVPLSYDHPPPYPHLVVPLVTHLLDAQAASAAGGRSPSSSSSSSATGTPPQAAQAAPATPPPKASLFASAARKVAALREVASRKVDEVRHHAHATAKSIADARDVDNFQTLFPSVARAGAGLVSAHRCRVISSAVPVACNLYVTTHALCVASDAFVATSSSSSGVAEAPPSPYKIYDVLPLEHIASIVPSVALPTRRDPACAAGNGGGATPASSRSGSDLVGSFPSSTDASVGGAEGAAAGPPPYFLPVPAESVAPNAICIYTWGTHKRVGAAPFADPAIHAPHVIQLFDFSHSFVQGYISGGGGGGGGGGAEGPPDTPTAAAGGRASGIAWDHDSQQGVSTVLGAIRCPAVRALYAIDRAWARRTRSEALAAVIAAIRGDGAYAAPHFR